MTTSRRVTWLGVTLAMLAASPAPGQWRGREFPDFTATEMMTGEPLRLSDLRGDVVLVDFWATWCGPCRRELPLVKEVWSRYRDRGLQIVSISLDSSEPRLRGFLESAGMDWLHVFEGSGWRSRLAQQYRVSSIPRMFLIDRNGVCTDDRVRGAQLEAAVVRALGIPGDGEPPAEARLDRAEAQLLLSLSETAEEIERCARPINEASRRLASIQLLLERLTGRLDDDRTRVVAAPQFASIVRELVQVRHTLFMMGVLGEDTVVRLVPDPGVLAATDPDARRRSYEAFATARAAVKQMRAACRDASLDTAGVFGQVKGLQRTLAAGAATAESVAPRVAAVQGAAAAIVGSLCDPWVDQVHRAAGMLERGQSVLTGHDAGLAALQLRLDMLRSDVAAVDDAEAAVQVRASVSAFTADLGRRAGRYVPAPADDAGVGEMGLALDGSAAVLDEARADLAARREHFDALAREAWQLHEQLERRLEEGGSLDPLRARLSDLALEALALPDASYAG